MRVRAVIVEDEPHARASLREYAGECEWLVLVREAGDGAEAIRLVDALEPDLLFLDISLPEASGVEVLGRIRHKPEVVFTTAYDQYALAAFELGALDYLLKPFGRERFRTMLERVRRRLHSEVSAPERASGDYAEVHVAGGAGHLLHTSLGELAARLDPDVFLQIHRSHIVNLDAVTKLVPFDARRLLVRLRNGTEIVASRAASSEALRSLVR